VSRYSSHDHVDEGELLLLTSEKDGYFVAYSDRPNDLARQVEDRGGLGKLASRARALEPSVSSSDGESSK
jgi:hypothetical protein